MYIGRRQHPPVGMRVSMLQEDSVPYESTHPDAYAQNVYGVPCWMIHDENTSKYAKRSKARLSMDSHVKIPKRKNMEPLLDDPMTLAIPSKAAESSVLSPETKSTRRLPVPVMAIREGTVPPGSASGIKKRLASEAFPLVKQEDEEEIKAKRRHLAAHEGQIVSLFCNHCKRTFKAKPTYRSRFNHTLVNHSCSGSKRRQYVLGVKRRKCMYDCNSVLGCIYRIEP